MDCFVTGTDTGVGKTVVSAAMALALRQRGIRVRALKPVATGVETGAGEDAELLAMAAGHEPAVCVTFRAPLSPQRAAALEGRRVDLATVLAWVQAQPGPRIVEGVGGWEVPLSWNTRVSDLAAALGYPVVVVAPDRLGVINHARLTVESAQRRSVPIVLVLVEQETPDSSAAYNKEDLERLLGVPVLRFPRVEGEEQRRRAGEAVWQLLTDTPATAADAPCPPEKPLPPAAFARR